LRWFDFGLIFEPGPEAFSMLTSTQARDAKPRAKQYELSCDAVPGFLLRVLPSGKKVFFVRYRDGGKDVRERLGLLGPEFGVDAARKAALAVLSGGSPAEEPRAIEAPRGARRRAQDELQAGEPPPAPRRSARSQDEAPSPTRARNARRQDEARDDLPSPTRARTTRPRDEEPDEAPSPSRARSARQRDEAPDEAPSSTRARGTRPRGGTLPAAPPAAEPPPPSMPTVAEFAKRFATDHIDAYLKPSTASHYRLALRRYIVPTFGNKPLDAITTTDVQRLHNSLRGKPSMANYVRCVLGVMFTKADKWQVTSRRSPVGAVGRFRENAVERFLTPEERAHLESVLQTCENTPRCQTGHLNAEAARAIRLLALTGMRRDEILNLTWPQVDWRQGMLRLPDSKTGKRDVVVSDEVLALLREIADAKGNPKNGRVVCSRTGQKLASLNVTWRRVRKLAGLDDVRLHDLRHSVASDAIMDGVPLEIVGKMLGHRNYHTTQRYAHIADTVLRDAVNKTGKTIARAAKGEPRRKSIE
jgi:integrase